MTVRVRFFASLIDRCDCDRTELEIPAGTTVDQLWQLLTERFPKLSEVQTRPLVACDQEYATGERLLDGVEEVAFLPPMSGG